MYSRIAMAGLGVMLGLAIVLLGWQLIGWSYTYQGSLIDPPVRAFDFSLADQNGDIFRLGDQRGSIVLISFGYTHCPDICPVTLTEFKRVREGLAGKAERVRFVFITVDPERDTQERLRTHLANYDAAIIGLSGERGELEPVWSKYGVYQAKRDEGSAAGYMVDHTSRTYLIDQDGNWRLTYPFEMESQAIVDDIQHLLSMNGK